MGGPRLTDPILNHGFWGCISSQGKGSWMTAELVACCRFSCTTKNVAKSIFWWARNLCRFPLCHGHPSAHDKTKASVIIGTLKQQILPGFGGLQMCWDEQRATVLGGRPLQTIADLRWGAKPLQPSSVGRMRRSYPVWDWFKWKVEPLAFWISRGAKVPGSTSSRLTSFWADVIRLQPTCCLSVQCGSDDFALLVFLVSNPRSNLSYSRIQYPYLGGFCEALATCAFGS